MLTKEQYYKIVEVGKITGYGFMFVRRALELMDWDIDRAIEYLKENNPYKYIRPKE